MIDEGELRRDANVFFSDIGDIINNNINNNISVTRYKCIDVNIS